MILLIMKIIVDERETALYDKMVADRTSVHILKEVLHIGDVVIQNDNNEDICIIERKTISDLLASIKDGRYEEQSHRLLHASGLQPHNILYLIEGMMTTVQQKDRQIVLSAMTSLNYFKGFSVIRTVNIIETSELIQGMALKIERNLRNSVQPTWSTNSTTLPYASIVKKVKKDNITPENISEIMLSQIPGVSNVTSSAIIKKFGSIRKLIDSLSENPECLSDLSYELNGKNRKINSKSIQNVVEFLMSSNS